MIGLAIAQQATKLHVNPNGETVEVPFDIQVGHNVFINGEATLGKKLVIGDNSVIGKYAVIGNGVKIGNDCRILCLVGNKAVIGNFVLASVKDFVISDKEIVPSHSVIGVPKVEVSDSRNIRTLAPSGIAPRSNKHR